METVLRQIHEQGQGSASSAGGEMKPPVVDRLGYQLEPIHPSTPSKTFPKRSTASSTITSKSMATRRGLDSRSVHYKDQCVAII
eukprot:5646342-Pyramimonas_sp.AAC.1